MQKHPQWPPEPACVSQDFCAWGTGCSPVRHSCLVTEARLTMGTTRTPLRETLTEPSLQVERDLNFSLVKTLHSAVSDIITAYLKT